MLSWYGPILAGDKCDRLQADLLVDQIVARDYKEELKWAALDESWTRLDSLEPPNRVELHRKLEAGLTVFGIVFGGRTFGKQWQTRQAQVQNLLIVEAPSLDEFTNIRR